jgi:hypothetical protein
MIIGIDISDERDVHAIAVPRNPMVISQHRFNRHPRKILARGIGREHHFGCTVVSATTRARSDGLSAPDPVARLPCNSAKSLSPPTR